MKRLKTREFRDSLNLDIGSVVITDAKGNDSHLFLTLQDAYSSSDISFGDIDSMPVTNITSLRTSFTKNTQSFRVEDRSGELRYILFKL